MKCQQKLVIIRLKYEENEIHPLLSSILTLPIVIVTDGKKKKKIWKCNFLDWINLYGFYIHKFWTVKKLKINWKHRISSKGSEKITACKTSNAFLLRESKIFALFCKHFSHPLDLLSFQNFTYLLYLNLLLRNISLKITLTHYFWRPLALFMARSPCWTWPTLRF